MEWPGFNCDLPKQYRDDTHRHVDQLNSIIVCDNSINQGGDTNRVPQYGKYHYDGRSPE